MNKVVRASFFKRDPLTCARELIGTELIWGECSGVVVEVEAYAAIDDEAAHTFTRPSARSFIERNKAGAAYVYFNYGVHWMLNVLVKGDANGFVLIRALEPRRGIELMKRRRGVNDLRQLCSGPGKLTQAFAITGRDHEMDLCSDPRHCFVSNSSATFDVVADKRIGISRSAHLPWRFTLRGSPFVSRGQGRSIVPSVALWATLGASRSEPRLHFIDSIRVFIEILRFDEQNQTACFARHERWSGLQRRRIFAARAGLRSHWRDDEGLAAGLYLARGGQMLRAAGGRRCARRGACARHSALRG